MTYSQLHQDFRSTHRPSGEAFFLLQLDLPLTFTGRGKLPKATSRSYEKSYGDETAHLCKLLILLKKFFGLDESRPLRHIQHRPLVGRCFLRVFCESGTCGRSSWEQSWEQPAQVHLTTATWPTRLGWSYMAPNGASRSGFRKTCCASTLNRPGFRGGRLV